MTDVIKILVVDDHALVRDVLAARLRTEPGFAVVGCVGTADEAIEQVIEHRPAIVLMDIDMPGLLCFDAAKRMAVLSPSTRVVFLSSYTHDAYVAQAIAVKAGGYLTKSESLDTMMGAIREVAEGGTCFCEAVRARIVVGPHGTRLAGQKRTRAETLTSRELEILRYLARGYAKKEIARISDISVKTVDRHSANLMAKLDIHDRVELARFAIREGIAEV